MTHCKYRSFFTKFNSIEETYRSPEIRFNAIMHILVFDIFDKLLIQKSFHVDTNALIFTIHIAFFILTSPILLHPLNRLIPHS